MTCYIIELPPQMNKTHLLALGVTPRSSFSCVNCFTADLTAWQVKNLMASGAILTEDSECNAL